MAHLLKRAGGGGAAADPLPDPKSRGVGLDVKQDRQERKVMPNRHGGPGTSESAALKIRVFRLQPCTRPSADVSRADALGHDALRGSYKDEEEFRQMSHDFEVLR